MRYLLDTHVLLWWLTDPDKLSITARKIIADRKNKIYVSSVSIWEMAIKKDLGRLTIPINLLSVIRMESIEILSLMPEESLGVIDLPKLHNDPFDRILITQAKLNDLVMITKDVNIAKYPLVTIPA